MTHTPETRTKTNGTQPGRVLVMWIPEDSVGRCLGKQTQTGAPESARHCRSSGSRLWCVFHHMWLMSVGGGFWSQLDPCSGCAAGYSVSVLWNEQSVTSQQFLSPAAPSGLDCVHSAESQLLWGTVGTLGSAQPPASRSSISPARPPCRGLWVDLSPCPLD